MRLAPLDRRITGTEVNWRALEHGGRSFRLQHSVGAAADPGATACLRPSTHPRPSLRVTLQYDVDVCVPAGTRNHFAADLGLDRRVTVGHAPRRNRDLSLPHSRRTSHLAWAAAEMISCRPPNDNWPIGLQRPPSVTKDPANELAGSSASCSAAQRPQSCDAALRASSCGQRGRPRTHRRRRIRASPA